MKRLMRWLAHKVGYSTSYHVAASFQQEGHLGTSIISMTIVVRPWAHVDNYREIVDYVASKATGCVKTPSITSLTKLGS